LAARGGADLVTLSSRRTQIAELSRTHLWLKPGTKKTALAAVAKVMIAKGWQDADFVRERTGGLDAFVRSLDALDLDGIEASTGLTLTEIEDLARRLSGAGSAMAFFSSGISGLDRETVAMIYDLFLLAGKIGREGCGVNPVTGVCNIVGSYDVGAARGFLPGHRKAEGTSAGRTPDELLSADPSPLRALVVADHDEELIRHAGRIKGLELVVYVGAYGNPFADLAHIVLPAATYAEADGTFTNTERRIQLNRKKVEPPAGVLPAWRIYADIAAKCGSKRPYGSAEEVMADIAASVPAYAAVTYPKLERGFGLQWPVDAAHPGGTVRLSVEDRSLPLRFVPVRGAFGAPAVSDEFPVRLMAGKAVHFWHRNNVMKKTHIPNREYNALLLLYPRGFVEIAVEDAARLGVRDRGPVAVVSAAGSMKVAARVSKDIRPGTAYVPYFIGEMVPGFLDAPGAAVATGEDSVIPVRIEKV
jgi:formate dehydrogenase major subunit